MTFDDIPNGSRLFVDANIFVYWFAGDPPLYAPCARLLSRIERTEVHGVISSALLSDVAHRMKTLEACKMFSWPYHGIGSRLRKHSAEIKKLRQFRAALADISLMGIEVADVCGVHVQRAADEALLHGILSGDALIVTIMREHQLQLIASHDADFDQIPGVIRFSPV